MQDASNCIQKMPNYVKGFYRRAKGNEGLKNFYLAAVDYQEILFLEPENKLCIKNLDVLKKKLS